MFKSFFQPFLLTAFLFFSIEMPAMKQGNWLARAIANEREVRCSPASDYVGEPLHAGADVRSLDSGFDLSGELDSELVLRLEETLDWALENTDALGITAAVGIPGQGIWSASAGLLQTEPEIPADETSVFWWASVGKMFTSSVILQLVAEGKLTLDRTIDAWFPNYPQARYITIEQLLTHTGGVFSFQQDLLLRQRSGYVTPEELVEVSAGHGADFCPGAYWSYSNTGYAMLAKIVEAIEGRSFAEAIERRIIEPLGLAQTIALQPEALPENLAIGHVDGNPATDFQPSLPFGAGNIVASSEDMVVFLAALLSGELYPRALLQSSLDRLYPMFDPGTYYGRGIMLYEVREGSALVNWIGHSGGSQKQGIRAIVAYDLDAEIFVAVATNANVPAEALAYKSIETVRQHRDLVGLKSVSSKK